MPTPLTEAVRAADTTARGKSAQTRSVPRYLVSSMLAGAYVGVAVVLLLSVTGPMAVAEVPATTLVQGAVFGIALTLVVFAGAELFTGNAMVMAQGRYAGTVRWRDLGAVWGLSLFGNLVGSILFAALVFGGGTLSGGSSGELLADIAAGKAALSGTELLLRSILCNFLVCLALWMAARTTSDAAKLGVLWWALLAFIASGFEHSVANMTIFGLATLEGSATWLELARNLAWTVPGNVIGGGILVGLVYSWLNGTRPSATPETGDEVDEAAPAAEPVDDAPEPEPVAAVERADAAAEPEPVELPTPAVERATR